MGGKPFFCQELADAGDQPYMPEFLDPNDRDGWKWANVDGLWFTYLIFSARCQTPLYVGRTNNIYRRLSQHTRRVWWPLVDNITVDSHESAEECAADEAFRINFYRPMFNIAGNRREATRS